MNTPSKQKVIIAGGTSGIGLAVATLLAQQQATVIATGRNADKVQAAANTHDNIQGVVVDSSNREALDAFFREQGTLDHLVIALSGAKGGGEFASLPLQDLRDGFEGKFWPQLHTLQAALPYINKGGSVTLITAISTVAKLPGTSGLTAINGALELMVPILAKECKPLRINAVAPGVIDTSWWDVFPAAVKEQSFAQFAAQTLAGRIGKAEEVADAISFLMKNEYITGTVLKCDGGLSA